MFLAVDINNFEISFFVVDNNGSVESTFRISAIEYKTADQYVSEIRNAFDFLKIDKSKVIYAGVVSSVPKLENIVIEFFDKYFKILPLIVSNKIVPINTLLPDINDIPTSILVGSYSALQSYGDNMLVVNFESIISFAAVIDNKFIGYAVYPGLEMLSSVVHEKTFIFPDVLTKVTSTAIGQNKYDALNCGLFNGCIGACDNIIQVTRETFNKKRLKVIATGKNADIFSNYCQQINEVSDQLIVKGILSIAKKSLLSI
jgi:type III pantothenate kinase